MKILIKLKSKFQVETIGDAYCVACGLHRNTHIHAQQIAWMALKMIQACSHHLTHKGKPIRVRKYLRLLNVFYYWVCIPFKIDIEIFSINLTSIKSVSDNVKILIKYYTRM